MFKIEFLYKKSIKKLVYCMGDIFDLIMLLIIIIKQQSF